VSYVHKPGTGMLFVNKTTNPKAPVRQGYIMTPDGRRLKLSGWMSTGDDGRPKLDRDGNPMLKLKAEWDVPREEGVEQAVRQAVKRSFGEDLDDQIPFAPEVR
jgi:hypothetical protein